MERRTPSWVDKNKKKLIGLAAGLGLAGLVGEGMRQKPNEGPRQENVPTIVEPDDSKEVEDMRRERDRQAEAERSREKDQENLRKAKETIYALFQKSKELNCPPSFFEELKKKFPGYEVKEGAYDVDNPNTTPEMRQIKYAVIRAPEDPSSFYRPGVVIHRLDGGLYKVDSASTVDGDTVVSEEGLEAMIDAKMQLASMLIDAAEASRSRAREAHAEIKKQMIDFAKEKGINLKDS